MGEAVGSDNELDLGNKGQFDQKVGPVNRRLQVQQLNSCPWPWAPSAAPLLLITKDKSIS